MTTCKTVKRRSVPSVKAVLFYFCICVGLLSIVFSKTISLSIIRTATATAKTVIPALFPFMLISSFMTDSSLYTYLEVFPGKFLEKVAGIQKEVSCAVVLGLLSGFPVGAATVCKLYKKGKISKIEAENALCQAHNTGPAFPISFIGTQLWGNTLFGTSLYISQLMSMILLSKTIFRNSTNKLKSICSHKTNINYTKVLNDSINKTALNCINICASIVFWKTVCELFTLFTPMINTVILSFFEFSSGAVAAAGLGGTVGAGLTGFSVGFGGLSALFQAAGFASEYELSIRKVFIFKFTQGVVCGLLTLMFYLIII